VDRQHEIPDLFLRFSGPFSTNAWTVHGEISTQPVGYHSGEKYAGDRPHKGAQESQPNAMNIFESFMNT